MGKSESPRGGGGRILLPRRGPLPGRRWRKAAGGSLARLRLPWQPQAWAPRGSLPAGALFLCRETRKLPFDCGSPRTGLGARQRGSEWQRGKGCAPAVPAASRVRNPPRAAAEVAAAAVAAGAPVHRQPRGKRAAPLGRTERAQQVIPLEELGLPASSLVDLIWVCITERDAEPCRRLGLVDRTEPPADWTSGASAV